jgi:hypothetical protein
MFKLVFSFSVDIFIIYSFLSYLCFVSVSFYKRFHHIIYLLLFHLHGACSFGGTLFSATRAAAIHLRISLLKAYPFGEFSGAVVLYWYCCQKIVPLGIEKILSHNSLKFSTLSIIYTGRFITSKQRD